MFMREAKNLMRSVSFFKVSLVILGVCVFFATSFKPSLAREVDSTLLATPGPLGDSVQGSEDAPITLTEYFSFTCYHCANFHKEIYPQIKSEYVDKGKVRYILRDFPLDSVAMSASILARCEGSKKYPAFADLLLKTQDKWAFSPKPLEILKEQMKQGGMTSERFDACLKDENLYKGILAVKTRAADGLGVNATPAFFINGERLPQGVTFKIFQEKINSLLPPEKIESDMP